MADLFTRVELLSLPMRLGREARIPRLGLPLAKLAGRSDWNPRTPER
jgi:hypothetical protein